MSEEILRAIVPELIAHFTPLAKTRGQLFFKEGHVQNFAMNFQKMRLSAELHDKRRVYDVAVHLDMQNDALAIAQSCSCATGNACKHIYALLLAAQARLAKSGESPIPFEAPLPIPPPSPKLSPPLVEWVFKLEQQLRQQVGSEESRTESRAVIWHLECQPTADGMRLGLSMEIARQFKGGEGGPLGNQKCCIADLFRSYSSAAPIKKLMSKEDWALVATLAKTHSETLNCTVVNLATNPSLELLQELINTQRCYLDEQMALPIRWGEEQRVRISWELNSSGTAQKAVCRSPHVGLLFFTDASEPFYLERTEGVIGRLLFDAPLPFVKALLAAPPVPHCDLEIFRATLRERFPSLAAYAPEEIKQRTVNEKPTCCLRLEVRKRGTEERVVGALAFDYGTERVPLEVNSNSIVYPPIAHLNKPGGEVVAIQRASDLERQAVKTLMSLRWDFYISYDRGRYEAFFRPIARSKELVQEVVSVLDGTKKQLERRGWKVELGDSFPFTAILRGDEWFMETATEEEKWQSQDWFDLRLGTYIDGKRINLLPALSEMLQTGGSSPEEMLAQLKNSDPDDLFPIATAERQIVMVPIARLCSILETLATAFANGKQLTRDGQLRVEKWDSMLLAEFSKAQDAAEVRWIGPENLYDLAIKIGGQQSLPHVPPPAGLKCQLRSYQQEGLNWLQFLHSCHLNGILADDMGLGKTIQTLAHLVVEKEQGRMKLPALIVAPTSLMSNWKSEAAHFAPGLKVLILQGINRHSYFDQIAQHDLILTTYPLLMRDRETLLAHQFHMLILDEAQMIKNAETQAYQIVQQIKAHHRLCLSGTPMENHLGELWALFNFLLPGLLGDKRHFHTAYRKPIEREGDLMRQTALMQRIKPFILRRTKQLVAQELPPKTEIIQSIDLGARQRDLYEAIRLKAQADLLAHIQEKGLAGSQIEVLDALLKLRQVCCHPRLVKVEHAIPDAESAKLEFLMETVPQMIEENRKLLIFSQFTSMLALVEESLREREISYTILTGDTTDRQTPVNSFQDGEVSVMLLSLKAGGTGLNLTAADTVIFLDPWWNPAVEDQAADRAYRIGQTKAVFVYKLVSSGTVEEKILALQGKKRSIANAIFESREASGVALTMEDLDHIFAPLPQS